MAWNNWSTWHTVSFYIFFNLKLTGGPITKILQTAETEAKQKKVQGPITHLRFILKTSKKVRHITVIVGPFARFFSSGVTMDLLSH